MISQLTDDSLDFSFYDLKKLGVEISTQKLSIYTYIYIYMHTLYKCIKSFINECLSINEQIHNRHLYSIPLNNVAFALI